MKRYLLLFAIGLLAMVVIVLGRAAWVPRDDNRPVEAPPVETRPVGIRLLTVESCSTTDQGLVVLPAVPMRSLSDRPELRRMQQGSRVELRLPDGTRRETRIVTYGVPVTKGEDGSLLVRGGPDGPEFDIRFTLSSDLRPEEVPAGTEVWYLVEPDA